jgi:hypothetical protein
MWCRMISYSGRGVVWVTTRQSIFSSLDGRRATNRYWRARHTGLRHSLLSNTLSHQDWVDTFHPLCGQLVLLRHEIWADGIPPSRRCDTLLNCRNG